VAVDRKHQLAESAKIEAIRAILTVLRGGAGGTTMNADPATISTEVIAVATVAYVFLTALIWYATWQNTRATRIILEAAQRPYLSIPRVELATPAYIGGSAKIAALISNVGTVPSRDVWICGSHIRMVKALDDHQTVTRPSQRCSRITR